MTQVPLQLAEKSSTGGSGLTTIGTLSRNSPVDWYFGRLSGQATAFGMRMAPVGIMLLMSLEIHWPIQSLMADQRG